MRKPILILLLALIVLRIPVLFHPILDVDEAIYGLFARIWFDGGIPYVDCVETKPLGIYLFFGSIFSLFGRFNMIAVHAATIAVVGATAYVIYLISKMIDSSKSGFIAALLYIVFSTTYIPKVIATTIEPIMLFPVSLQFYFWLRYERDSNWPSAFLSGLFFSMACLFKYQAGMNLFVLFAYLIFVKHKVPSKGVRLLTGGLQIGVPLKGVGHFFLGAIWLPLIMIAYLAYVKGLDGFYYWNILGNRNYISEGSSTINLPHQILTRVLPYIASTLLMWILSILRIVKRDNSSATLWLIILWFVLSIIPVSTGYRFYGHYFLLLLPPMAILSAPIIERVWDDPLKVWKRRLIVLAILLPAFGFSTARLNMDKIHNAFKEDNLNNYKPLAAYLAKNTLPSDKVIAWGFAPLVYWYSERLPGTRFFWSDLLTSRVSGLKGVEASGSSEEGRKEAWEMFFRDLEKNKPVYIIDTAPANLHDYKDFPITKYPRLHEYVQAHYKTDVIINHAIFYKRID